MPQNLADASESLLYEAACAGIQSRSSYLMIYELNPPFYQPIPDSLPVVIGFGLGGFLCFLSFWLPVVIHHTIILESGNRSTAEPLPDISKLVSTWLYLQLKSAIRGLVPAPPFLAGRRRGIGRNCRDATAIIVATRRGMRNWLC